MHIWIFVYILWGKNMSIDFSRQRVIENEEFNMCAILLSYSIHRDMIQFWNQMCTPRGENARISIQFWISANSDPRSDLANHYDGNSKIRIRHLKFASIEKCYKEANRFESPSACIIAFNIWFVRIMQVGCVCVCVWS